MNDTGWLIIAISAGYTKSICVCVLRFEVKLGYVRYWSRACLLDFVCRTIRRGSMYEGLDIYVLTVSCGLLLAWM